MKAILDYYHLVISDWKHLDGDINYTNIKYELQAEGGKKYILKIFPDRDELALAREETRILNEIGGRLSFKVPQTILTADNQFFFSHESGSAKLLEYIEGDFIADVPHTSELLFSLGAKNAEFDQSLKDIESPLFRSRKLFWDIQHAMLSLPKLTYIQNPAQRKWVAYFLDRFQHIVLPQQHQLRHSLIHGDLNDYNVLITDGRIEGFLDFGDATYSPVINSLAVTMTYMMLHMEDPVIGILPVLKGYHSLNPLTRLEIELLPELISARLCISVCNSAEKKYLGEDTDYVLITEKPAWALLEKWITINPLRFRNAFLDAVGFETDNSDALRNTLLQTRQSQTSPAMSLSFSAPVHMTAAAFQYMYDGHGNSYLDAYNNIVHVGHCHPAITSAISRQARILNTNTRYLSEVFTNYVSNLLSHFPTRLDKVFLVNSGSEATDLAIRMARNFTQRNTMAVLEHGYHGNTTLDIEVSAYKFDGRGGKGAGSSTLRLPLPNSFQGIYRTGKEYADDAIHRLKAEIEKGNHPCAFIAEPISGCGGQVPLAEGYWKELKLFLDAHDILSICDEVQVGFGRLGSWFWGFEMHGIVPDIVILGKPIGNGHPMAAVVTTAEIADRFANGMEFFSSFGGNPVSCAVGTAVLEVIHEEQLQSNALKVGAYFQKRLMEVKAQHPGIGDVRGEGLFIGIEFVKSDQLPDRDTTSFVMNQLKERFILTGIDGPHQNVIKIKPPLCFTKTNVDTVVENIKSILEKRYQEG